MALSAVGLQTHIWNNNAKSVALLMGYPLLLLLMLWMFFAGLTLFGQPQGNDGMALAAAAGWQGVTQYWYHVLGFAAVWFVIAWLFHQNMVNMSTGARKLTRAENPRIYNLLENLCISRGITMPKLYMIDTPVLNAYASGLSEKSYAITVTAGIVEALNDAELEAVLAHELTHVMNRDVRLLIIGVIFAGMISFFAEMLFRSMVYGSHRSYSRDRRSSGHIIIVAMVVLAVGYIFSLVIRMAISRKREYLADAGAVELTKNPNAMVSALQKISGKAKMEDVPAEVQQMFIENPPSAFGMFDTHPSIEARIWALQQYAGAAADIPQRKSPWQRAPRSGPWQRR
jgi:heat shock protein HtpX